MRGRGQRGFNLLELMFAVLIAGITLGIGIPSFNQFTANSRMAGAANELMTSIHVARTEAVKRRVPATLCASSDWASEDPGCDLDSGTGWIVFADVDGDVVVDDGDVVLQSHAPLAEPLSFEFDVASVAYLQFGPGGVPRTAPAGTPISNIQICDNRGDVATGRTPPTAGDEEGREIAAGRWLQINAAGRPQVYRTRDEVQANPIGGC